MEPPMHADRCRPRRIRPAARAESSLSTMLGVERVAPVGTSRPIYGSPAGSAASSRTFARPFASPIGVDAEPHDVVKVLLHGRRLEAGGRQIGARRRGVE